MEQLNINDIEKFIDDKINTKFTLIDRLVDEKIQSKFSLSIKYWYPTIITVVIATTSAVWWFRGQLKPLEYELTLLKNKGTGAVLTNEDPVVSIEYLIDVKINDEFNEDQKKALEDIAYTLNNERKDLVVIIAGYTGKDDKSPKSKQISDSELVARKIQNYLLKMQVNKDRIFCKGHGPETPDDYIKKDPLNACLMMCDVFHLMKMRVKA